MTLIKWAAAGAALIMTLLLTACGGETGGGNTVNPDPADGDAAAACPQGEPECVDTPELGDGTPVPIDEEGLEQLRRDAQYYLGKKQSELNELIRIARIDDEQFALTQDYVVGRITVELDDVDGEVIVTRSTVELPDGPETFEYDG